MDLPNFREPDIEITALKIWVHDRQFEESQDYWDGNWIRATALCARGGVSVQADGPFLHLSELAKFLNELVELNDTLQGEAVLSCMEPNLGVKLSVTDSLGHINAEIELTPDPMTQSIVAVPMLGLYGLSILIAMVVGKKKEPESKDSDSDLSG